MTAKTTCSSGNLNKKQHVKIRKLLRSQDPDNGEIALSLLDVIANQYDYRETFSLTVVKKLINAGMLNLMAVGVVRAADKELFADAVAYLRGKLDSLEIQDRTIKVELIRMLRGSFDWLDLSNLTELDEAQARELAKHEGSVLDLSGLTELSSDVAAALSQYRGSSLQLNGITQISVDVAEQLAAYAGAILSLSSIKTLPDNIAHVFARSNVLYLDLREVDQLSSEAMDAFQKHNRLANLTGIKQTNKKEEAFDLWMRQRSMVVWLELCDGYVDPKQFACKRDWGCRMSDLPDAASRVAVQLRKPGEQNRYIWY